MIRRLFLPAVLVLLAAAAPAPAPADKPGPDRPSVIPTRDAVVGYHLAPATGEAINVRVVVRTGGTMMRVDLPDQTYMLAAPVAQALVMVVPAERTAVELPWNDGPQSLFLLDERMRFTRKGESTVAGQKCTEYDTQLDRARSTVCVTPSGIVLRNVSADALGRRNLVEAFIIRYQTLPDEDFVVPPGFDRLVPPAAPAGK